MGHLVLEAFADGTLLIQEATQGCRLLQLCVYARVEVSGGDWAQGAAGSQAAGERGRTGFAEEREGRRKE